MTLSQTTQTPGGWTIGPYTLDGEGHLRLGPTPIHLAPLQRRLLQALVLRRGQVLSREALLQEVWGHTQVSEVSISRTVHGLRRILAEGPLGPAAIRTIYGGGYRLEAPIHPLVQPDDGVLTSVPDGRPAFPTVQTLSSFVEGLVWLRQRDPRQLERAETHLRRTVEMAPNFTPALVQLAECQLAQYRWGLLSAQTLGPELERLLGQAEASGHMPLDVLALRVEALSLLHWQPELAETRFASWLPNQLAEGTALHCWVRHLLATGRAAQALDLLEPHLTTGTPDGWLLAATAWWHQGDHGKAITCLQQQLHIDGSLLAARLLLAVVLADAARPADALRELEGAAIVADLHNGLQGIVALVLALCGRSALATARLQSALAHGQQGLTMKSLWGLAALAAGDEKNAERLLESAVIGRCGLAPFVQHMPGLQRYTQSAALAQFQEGMTNRFRRTF